MGFWTEVHQFKDAAGSNPFKELSMAAVSVLSLPHSNAEIERVFSQMGVVKTKLRNRMSLETLNSILYVRYGLKLAGEACFEHKLPDSVLRQFGTSVAYSFKAAPSAATGAASTSTAPEAAVDQGVLVLDESDEDGDIM